MPKRIYVGNLPFSASDDEIRTMFRPFGAVRSVQLGRGEATVELESDAAALKAIKALGGTRLKGNVLKVNEARPRSD